ncbi:hypothetical protein CO652_29180 [Rhizobium sp. H4]|nr:hypothetical protein CO652_29180 [Rhizobium sp. H4]
MEKHFVKADGTGMIDVNGQVSPVTYTVSFKEGMGRAAASAAARPPCGRLVSTWRILRASSSRV